MTKHIPLLFTYRDRVIGDDFSADVESHGRVLGVEEGDNDFWVYGIQPGALAASGTTPREALEAFRASFTEVLKDFAADVANFAEFDQAVQSFFNAVNEPAEADWLRAVEAVRAGEIDIPGVRRERAEATRYVHVQQAPVSNPTLSHRQQFSVSVGMDSSIAA